MFQLRAHILFQLTITIFFYTITHQLCENIFNHICGVVDEQTKYLQIKKQNCSRKICHLQLGKTELKNFYFAKIKTG